MGRHVGICPNCGSRDTKFHDDLHRWCNGCQQVYTLSEIKENE